MRILLYPNGEIRARLPSIVPVPRSDCRVLSSAPLVNREKLAISVLPPVEACVYPSCPVLRPGYGGECRPRTFSLYSRRQISRCGGVFVPASTGRLVFLTGTLPGGTDAACRAMASNSAWLVHELLTRIPRVLGIKASETQYMWVWEWQERGALHWHAVFQLPTDVIAQRLIDVFKGVWCSVIDGLSKRSGVDCAERIEGGSWAGMYEYWRVDAQIAISQPQNYLSKYLGKESGKGAAAMGYYPSRWYGCSRRILLELREQTLSFSLPVLFRGPTWSYGAREIRILSYLQRHSDYSVSFADRFKTGVTCVFYSNPQIIGGLYSRVKRIMAHFSSGRALFSAAEKAKVPLPRKGVWFNIEAVCRYTDVQDRLYSDLGGRQQAILEGYLLGRGGDPHDLEIIDRHALRLLLFSGLRQSVKPPQRSGAGLTEESLEQTGGSGGFSQESLFPGLPF